MVIVTLLVIPPVQAETKIPTYQLDKNEQLVLNYLYRLLPESHNQRFTNIIDFKGAEWKESHTSNGDLLIMPGDNWFAFKLKNNNKKEKQFYFEVANQVRISNAQLYIQNNLQVVTKQAMELQLSNNRSTMVTIAPDSQVTLYLIIKSPSQIRSTARLYSSKAYMEAKTQLQFQQGVAIGGLLFLSIALMLLFFTTGNRPTFILFGYFLSNTLMLSALLGFNLYYLFPHLPELAGIELPLLTSSIGIFLLFFTSQLFDLNTKYVRIHQVIRVSFWGLLLYMPLSVQLSTADNITISMFLYTLIMFSMVILGMYLYKQACRLALLFTNVMAFQCVFILVVIASVNWYGLGIFTHRTMFYSVIFWLNSLLIILLMSRQYRYQLRDKLDAQRQVLASAVTSERAQEELLALQLQSQEELENRVQERTLELNIALQELEDANQELEQKNTLDELTGLYNRRFYDQKILAEYRRSKRNLTPLSLVLIDIDHFKSINDTHGHLAGDQCLVWLGEQIKQNMKRSTDMAFRYGGEEFCLILPDTDSKGAVILTETLRKNIAKQACLYKEINIPLTISNGIYTYLQQDNVMPEQIFSGADKALYQAKRDGRNRTQQYSEMLNTTEEL